MAAVTTGAPALTSDAATSRPTASEMHWTAPRPSIQPARSLGANR